MAPDFDVSIVDQYVRVMAERLESRFAKMLGKKVDATLARSLSFVAICVQKRFDLSEDEALDCITDGGNDFGIDAMLIEDVGKDDLLIALFQCKYRHKLDGLHAFPQDGVGKIAQAVHMLLEQEAQLTLNPRLRIKIAEARARRREGNRIPRVVVVLCNNGPRWESPAQEMIDAHRFSAQVSFEHLNHKALVARLAAPRPIHDTVQFVGESILEDDHGVREVTGKVPAHELARLVAAHGDALFDRNVRRYLGVSGIAVNREIRETLMDPIKRRQFHILNLGITMICSRLTYNKLQKKDHHSRVEGLQIVNGAQTSRAIHDVLARCAGKPGWEDTLVRIHLFEAVPGLHDTLVEEITRANNHQIPIELVDLYANHPKQRQMALSFAALDHQLVRQRGESIPVNGIDTLTAVSAVTAMWFEQPWQIAHGVERFFERQFAKVFGEERNGAQLVLAAHVFKAARLQCAYDSPHTVLSTRCALGWRAMLMGRLLLGELALRFDQLDHLNFKAASRLFTEHRARYFEQAVASLRAGVIKLYGERELSEEELLSLLRSEALMQVL